MVPFSVSYLDTTLFDIYSLKFASITGATTAGAALKPWLTMSKPECSLSS